MTAFASTRLRLRCDPTNFDGPRNALTRAALAWFNRSDLQFELGLFNGGALVEDVSQVQQVILRVLALADNETLGIAGAPPAPDASALIDKAIIGLTNGLTDDTWADGSAQHGVIRVSASENNLAAGDYWLEIIAVTADGRVVAGVAGKIRVHESAIAVDLSGSLLSAGKDGGNYRIQNDLLIELLNTTSDEFVTVWADVEDGVPVIEVVDTDDAADQVGGAYAPAVGANVRFRNGGLWLYNAKNNNWYRVKGQRVDGVFLPYLDAAADNELVPLGGYAQAEPDGADWRVKDDGTLQLLVPDDNLYHTLQVQEADGVRTVILDQTGEA